MYYITVKTQFRGEHRYAGAPVEVSFLRNWHRHIFYVRATIKVDHSNRELEFFMIQRKIDEYLKVCYEGRQFEQSCEQIAKDVFDYIGTLKATCLRVEVSEDDENIGGYSNE